MLGQPWKGYYLTAYGIAVKHGFVGTEEEWLRSLRGDVGAAAELRYNEQEKALEWRPEGGETWKAIVPLSELQGEVISATLEEAASAKKDATEAKAQAKASAKAAAESETKAMAAERKILSHIQDYGNVVSGAYVRDDVLYIQTSSGKTFAAGNVRGGQGNTGDPGVYIGAEEPTNADVRVWIDPSDHETLDEVMGILDNLRYTDGGVEVDLSDYAKESALLGLAYIPATVGDEGFVATIPGITELKAGVIARIIPEDSCGSGGYLNVNGLGNRPIMRYGSAGNFDDFPIVELCDGKPVELVYDGTYWICTQMSKPVATDVYDLDYFLYREKVAKAVHGSYTGDGAAERSFNIGGKPQLIVIADGAFGALWVGARAVGGDYVRCVKLTYAGEYASPAGIGFADDGFFVFNDSDCLLNSSGTTYTYTVFFN